MKIENRTDFIVRKIYASVVRKVRQKKTTKHGPVTNGCITVLHDRTNNNNSSDSCLEFIPTQRRQPVTVTLFAFPECLVFDALARCYR